MTHREIQVKFTIEVADNKVVSKNIKKKKKKISKWFIYYWTILKELDFDSCENCDTNDRCFR